jgi:hypothetical protein
MYIYIYTDLYNVPLERNEWARQTESRFITIYTYMGVSLNKLCTAILESFFSFVMLTYLTFILPWIRAYNLRNVQNTIHMNRQCKWNVIRSQKWHLF